ncbi:LysR family transcriptional regulator [Arenicella xantha]|uniref:DNA-binding transcriptional LysR family regulator n=1 Tax=Arenicella xantha TaxID=644221 RepID=A0A395JF36_9GAMM|nr:LysR family transcriptional regulator [Arenicella xantha]RBP47168.1 DNA-binding transcriptional LysR family regulator [Arenicella xantha]
MRFKGLDLNLLVALDALLDEKSVTKAAQRVHLSQPAMTAALGRIRDYFDDPILKLHGKRMVPTSHALRIQNDLKRVLGSVDSLISKTALFEPSTSSRKFIITASDYVSHVVFVPLLRRLKSIAPHIQVELIPPADSTHELLSQGVIDFVCLPSQMLAPEFPSEYLFQERFVVVGCKTNPVFKNDLSEEQFYESGHVVVKLGRLRPQSVSDQSLEARKKMRDTDVLVSSFHLAPEMVVNTDRITVMHERLAKIFAERLPIAITDVPFTFPIFEEYVQYHNTRVDDPGIRWMIDQVKDTIGNHEHE